MSRELFVVTVRYLKSTQEVDQHRDAHRAYLTEQAAVGRVLFAGPKEPREGGVIIAVGADRSEVEDLGRHDPYVKAGVAEYDIVQFRPVVVNPAMPGPWGDSQDG